MKPTWTKDRLKLLTTDPSDHWVCRGRGFHSLSQQNDDPNDDHCFACGLTRKELMEKPRAEWEGD